MNDGNIELIERIIISNDYHNRYSTFDEFFDNKIVNSFVVCDGPAIPMVELTVEDIAARRQKVKEYLEPKYWTKK